MPSPRVEVVAQTFRYTVHNRYWLLLRDRIEHRCPQYIWLEDARGKRGVVWRDIDLYTMYKAGAVLGPHVFVVAGDSEVDKNGRCRTGVGCNSERLSVAGL